MDPDLIKDLRQFLHFFVNSLLKKALQDLRENSRSYICIYFLGVLDMVIKVSNIVFFFIKVPLVHHEGPLKFEFSKNYFELLNQ